MSTDLSALHCTVDGHVQGVGFRMFVSQSAERLGLVGWVRNTWDGQVEVWAEGPRTDLEELLAALRRGPRSAFVTEVKTGWEDAKGSYTRFSIAPTV